MAFTNIKFNLIEMDKSKTSASAANFLKSIKTKNKTKKKQGKSFPPGGDRNKYLIMFYYATKKVKSRI